MPGAWPRIVLNLKSYAQATGPAAVALAEAARDVAQESGVKFAVAPMAVDLSAVAAVGVPTWAQHFDPVDPGSTTGWLPLEALVAAGASGSLLNHSEHRIPLEMIQAGVQRTRRLRVASLVCSKDAAETGQLGAACTPDLIAVEPPELIGGDVSVTSADPEVVSSAAEALMQHAPGVRLLCGAGIKTRADVAAALELGAYGVLLASGVTKAKDPKAVMADLAAGIH